MRRMEGERRGKRVLRVRIAWVCKGAWIKFRLYAERADAVSSRLVCVWDLSFKVFSRRVNSRS